MRSRPPCKNKYTPLIKTCGLQHNLNIYDVEFKGGFLKVFVCHKNHRAVSVKDCEVFLKTLTFLFHSEGIKHRPLEVSSPGLNRPLKTPAHFLTAIGQRVQITFFTEGEKTTKQLNARLKGFTKNSLQLVQGEKQWSVSWNQIKKARVDDFFKAQSTDKKAFPLKKLEKTLKKS